MPKALVTGSAGFIGSHVARRLLDSGWEVIGLDNLNDYYAVELKIARNADLEAKAGYELIRADLADLERIREVIAERRPDRIFHLAAQAGVRYSVENPWVFLESNIRGTENLLEAVRSAELAAHLVFASSSSVYGLSERIPFREDDPADRPASVYGATKRACELLLHTYAHLYGIRSTALRYFTVYGPWGRPDMALFSFVRRALAGEEIELFNHGKMERDFTYVDDIVEATLAIGEARAERGEPYVPLNVGCSKPRSLADFVSAIRTALGVELRTVNKPKQEGDLLRTWADTSRIRALIPWEPSVELEEGVRRFVKWYRAFYSV